MLARMPIYSDIFTLGMCELMVVLFLLLIFLKPKLGIYLMISVVYGHDRMTWGEISRFAPTEIDEH